MMEFAGTYRGTGMRSPIDRQESKSMDPSLEPFLEATDETDAERKLGQLIAESSATIKSIVRDKLRVSLGPNDGTPENEDALEVISDVQAQLFAALKRLKSSSKQEAIRDFQGYLAVVTYHSCYQHLRRKYPERSRLKNRLRYLLSHRPTLQLWKNDKGEFLCGLSERNRRGRVDTHTPLPELSEALPATLLAQVSTKAPQPGPLTELVTHLLERADGALLLDDLVSMVANLCDMPSQATRTDRSNEAMEYRSAQLADPRVDFAIALEQRMHLERLWKEINEMPLRHRAAILLNLRDTEGRGVITLLPITRVATIRQIADALEFSVEDFAKVWSELPWDDAKIGQHLGLTRQQVINLRHSARARLARRVKGF